MAVRVLPLHSLPAATVAPSSSQAWTGITSRVRSGPQ